MLRFMDNKIYNNESGKRLVENHCAYCAWVTFTVMQIKRLVVVSGRRSRQHCRFKFCFHRSCTFVSYIDRREAEELPSQPSPGNDVAYEKRLHIPGKHPCDVCNCYRGPPTGFCQQCCHY